MPFNRTARRGAAWLPFCLFAPLALAQPASDLADLSLEELANLEVTSVSRRSERLLDAPASIYVITGEDIRRSGVTSLPEALRLAPNLQVARIDASQYAISARGFNNSIGNKLLVLIDGRTVYTPLFSGVFWDQQDVMLEDVERIEVISGPGATLWGANAVNGVINVITRPAQRTQGTLATLGVGTQEHGFAARYGGELSNGGHFRIYAKGTQLQNTTTPTGAAFFDGRDWLQTGFRADWQGGRGGFTLQGDAYSGRSDDRGANLGPVELSGMNLLARWTRQLEDGSELKVQGYFDASRRLERILFHPEREIFDIEVQHAIPRGAHRLMWGAGYRRSNDRVKDALLGGLRPKSRELEWGNVFIQDEIRLAPSLEVTLGLKLEHNDYTGLEHLPSARIGWNPGRSSLIWASVSRAVRTPARFDRDVIVPILPGFSLGGPDFKSEIAVVYELGAKVELSRTVSGSLTLFRHDWDRLRSGTLPPLLIENRMSGVAHGVESWASWQATPRWRLSGGFLVMDKHLRLEPGSTDPVGVDNPTLANDPEYQWTLRSSHNLGASGELDAMVRRVGALPNPRVPHYTAVDVRYAWRPRRDLEVSLTVQNLFDDNHPEFNPGPARSEFERAAFLKLRWSQ